MNTPIKQVFGTYRLSARFSQALCLVVALGLMVRSPGRNSSAAPGVEDKDPRIQHPLSKMDPGVSIKGASRNVSVYVVGRGGDQIGSMFLSHTVDRFGSGKMNYDILNLPSQKAFRRYLAREDLKPPCIIVRRGLGKVGGKNSSNVCANMVSGDESCNSRGPETEHIRRYYGKERNGNHTPYLPLATAPVLLSHLDAHLFSMQSSQRICLLRENG